MKLSIVSDTNSETGVREAKGDSEFDALMAFLKPVNYGEGLIGICVVLMCRAPDLDFKRRIRLSKKEKELYMDIMLDYEVMTNSTHETRKKIIMERMTKEIPEVLLSKNIQNFDRDRFLVDLKKWAGSIEGT